jgi:hypothetical protein
MTAYLAKTLRQAGLVLAFAVSLSALSSTVGFAFSAETQQMCTGDAMRSGSAAPKSPTFRRSLPACTSTGPI